MLPEHFATTVHHSYTLLNIIVAPLTTSVKPHCGFGCTQWLAFVDRGVDGLRDALKDIDFSPVHKDKVCVCSLL